MVLVPQDGEITINIGSHFRDISGLELSFVSFSVLKTLLISSMRA